MNIDDFRFTRDHEWVSPSEDGIVKIGITDYAQQELGDIVFVELPDVDSDRDAGEVAVTIESVKAASDIYAPVTGQVVEINEELNDEPELINESAFDAGWLFALKIEDEADLDELMDYDAYKKFVEEQE